MLFDAVNYNFYYEDIGMYAGVKCFIKVNIQNISTSAPSAQVCEKKEIEKMFKERML